MIPCTLQSCRFRTFWQLALARHVFRRTDVSGSQLGEQQVRLVVRHTSRSRFFLETAKESPTCGRKIGCAPESSVAPKADMLTNEYDSVAPLADEGLELETLPVHLNRPGVSPGTRCSLALLLWRSLRSRDAPHGRRRCCGRGSCGSRRRAPAEALLRHHPEWQQKGGEMPRRMLKRRARLSQDRHGRDLDTRRGDRRVQVRQEAKIRSARPKGVKKMGAKTSATQAPPNIPKAASPAKPTPAPSPKRRPLPPFQAVLPQLFEQDLLEGGTARSAGILDK